MTRSTDANEPVIVIGDEVARSGHTAIQQAVAFAETSGARVHGEFIMAEANFPTDHDQWGGMVPGSESGFIETVDGDTIIFIGCGSATTSIGHDDTLLPEATIVQIGPDGWELGKNWPADASVLGDPRYVLKELTTTIKDRLSANDRRARLKHAKDTAARLRSAARPAEPDRDDPRASKGQLGRAVAETTSDALIINESITTSRALLWHVSLGPEQWIGTKSGGLGYGLPAAVGAAMAESDRPDSRDVIAVIGDGSYFYYPQTLYSAVRHDVDLTVIVADNQNYRILKDNTKRVLGGTEGDHEFVGMDFDPPINIPSNAESYGARSETVDSRDSIADAIREARSDNGPTVLDVLIHD